MLKKPSIVALAILFSGILLLNVPAQADYDDLEKKVEMLSKSVYSLEDTVKELSFQLQQSQAMSSIIKELSFQLKQAESGIRDLQGVYEKVDNLYPKILNLEGTLQGLAASINEKQSILQGRVFDLETSTQGIDSRLKAVEGNVRELLKLQNAVEKLNDRVFGLEEFRSRLEQMPSGSPEDMARLMARFETMRMETATQLTALSDRLTALEQQLGGLATLQEQIDRNRNRVAALEVNKAETSEVDALRAQMAQMESNFSAQLESVNATAQQNMIIAGLGLALGAVALASAFGIF